MLAIIDRRSSLTKRIGVCLDTCHVFAAGYPLAPAAALEDTLDAFDATIGLDRLVVIHANDSKKPCGSASTGTRRSARERSAAEPSGS